ncbi:MAG: ABC transporter permease [Anaerolineaceae bacterium]|nr:ABC transporter permease [Anaerolineaceae bacterium]
MRNIWIIARKEYKQYFISPIAYAVAFMLFLIIGIIFYANIQQAILQQGSSAPGIDIVVGPMVTIFLFTTPAITMRMISEENRSGTMELLLTAPIRDSELIVGKWLGGFLFILTILIVTWIYPIVLNLLVKPGIDQGILITGYLGLALLMAAILSIGVATSSFFSNQIAAFFACSGVLLILWLINLPAQATGETAGLLNYLALSEHFYNTFLLGVIDLKDVIYYLSVTAVALFLGTISIETRRWR